MLVIQQHHGCESVHLLHNHSAESAQACKQASVKISISFSMPVEYNIKQFNNTIITFFLLNHQNLVMGRLIMHTYTSYSTLLRSHYLRTLRSHTHLWGSVHACLTLLSFCFKKQFLFWFWLCHISGFYAFWIFT